VPSQVAALAFAPTGQLMHDVPQELTLVSETHWPLQSCVPCGQVAMSAPPPPP
jgi:hypothetical protein